MNARTINPIEAAINLRRRRRQAGITQQALASAAGCSITTIRSTEYGVTPSTQMATRIVDALGRLEAADEHTP